MPISELVTEFLEVQGYIESLKAREEELRNEIRDYILSEGAKTIKMPQGTFSTVERTTWQYSLEYEVAKEEVEEEIKAIMEPLKKMQKIEQLNGNAKPTIKIGLAFKKNL